MERNHGAVAEEQTITNKRRDSSIHLEERRRREQERQEGAQQQEQQQSFSLMWDHVKFPPSVWRETSSLTNTQHNGVTAET